MEGWDAFYSCEASWSGGQSAPHCSQIACLGSLNRPQPAYRQTSLMQAEPLAATYDNRDGDHSTYDLKRRSTCSGETSRYASASAVFFPPVMLALFPIIGRTMRGTFGGINEEAIHPVQRRFPILRCRQLALGHQCKMHQGSVQHRRERMQVCIGFRARHLTLLPEHITGGIRLVRREDKRQFLCHRWQFPFGTTARLTSSRAGCDPVVIRLLPGCLVQVSEDGQQRVALGLGQAGESFHLTVVSDE